MGHGFSHSRLRHRFSRAARTYAAHAVVQRQAAAELASLLPARLEAAGWLLEIGCGPGVFSAELCHRYPERRIVALDFSHAMTVEAHRRLPGGGRVGLLCADGEHLPFPARPLFALAASNAVFQWFADPLTAVARVAERLLPSGWFLAAMFGPASLAELGSGLRQVVGEDVRLPAEDFPPLDAYRRCFSRHFAQVQSWRRIYRREYPSCRQMLAHLRRTGTSGGGRGAPRLRPGHLPALDRWFGERFGGCFLSFEVFFFVARAA